jgi:hypothetical protein
VYKRRRVPSFILLPNEGLPSGIRNKHPLSANQVSDTQMGRTHHPSVHQIYRLRNTSTHSLTLAIPKLIVGL